VGLLFSCSFVAGVTSHHTDRRAVLCPFLPFPSLLVRQLTSIQFVGCVCCYPVIGLVHQSVPCQITDRIAHHNGPLNERPSERLCSSQPPISFDAVRLVRSLHPFPQPSSLSVSVFAVFLNLT
jgi:hypothetical protein